MSSGFLRGQDRGVGRVLRTRVRFLDAYQGTGTIRPSPSADGKRVRSNESQFAHDTLRPLNRMRKQASMADKNEAAGVGEIPQRPLGRTGVQVSALGIGGHHLGDFKVVEDAIRLVHEAVDAGITFCDNCWEYWNGRAEDWLGRALQGRRDKVFLMTKVCTHGRGANLA